MVTADEIAGVTIFAGLSEVQRERLSRIVADIRVGPGEYVVHPGEERALFAETAWLPPEVALDHNGYVLTGSDVPVDAREELDRDPYLLETSVPRVFACGDVRFSPVKRVAAAVGEGSMAIAFVHQFLKDSPDRATA
jgi:thioredoxin reductase